MAKSNLLELLRLDSEEILSETDQGSVYAYYFLPDDVTPDPTTLYAPHRDGLKRYMGNLVDLPGISYDCNIGPPDPDPIAPVWNGSLTLPNFTGGQLYEQQLPFSALTPASGKTITNITVGAYLPSFLSIQPGGPGYVWLRGTFPVGSSNVAFTLRGVQSDGLVKDQAFYVFPGSTAYPPTWNSLFGFTGFFAGRPYSQNIYFSELTPATGKTIISIVAVSLPDYLSVEIGTTNDIYVIGTIPPGTTSITLELQGIQSDGLTANKVFTIAPGIAPPVWNDSLVFARFTAGEFYEQLIPFTALTPAVGQVIVDIQGIDLPGFLSIQPGGSDFVYLRGTAPSDAGYFIFQLFGIQSDGQVAVKGFVVPEAEELIPPTWNETLTFPRYTGGVFYEYAVPFSALTPAPGKAIIDITLTTGSPYVTIEPGGSDFVYLRGTFPVGSGSVLISLTGVQSDGQTADYEFAFYELPPPEAEPPVWNDTLSLADYTPGVFYEQILPYTSLTPASGQTITNIIGVNLPGYLTIQTGTDGYRYLRGTIPIGTTSVSIELQGIQSDGLTANETFEIASAPEPPAWNGSLVFSGFTPGAYYEQKLPFTALTPASGQTITNIIGVTLPYYFVVEVGAGDFLYLRGSVPVGTTSISVVLQGVQSDGLTANQGFALVPVVISSPPIWNGSWTPTGYTPGAYFEKPIPISALTPASGKTITDIVGVNLPSYLEVATAGGDFRWYLRGTIPAGTTSVSFELKGVQSDGKTANRVFTIYPLPVSIAPVWNNTLSLSEYIAGGYYNVQLPFTALTPAPGKTIVDIIPAALPSFLSILPGGSGVKYLQGFIPAGYASLSFTLKGVQSDGLTANRSFTIYPAVGLPPVWNNSFSLPSYTTVGTEYNQQLPFSALTPASGVSITDIVAVSLPSYLTIQVAVDGYRVIRGVIPPGSGNVSVILRGVQSDGLTADKVFAISPAYVPAPPVWNNSLILTSYVEGQPYEQKLPFTALTPNGGQAITNIVAVYLPSYLSIQTDGSTGYRWLRGTVPAGSSSVAFTLQGVQGDGLTANKEFAIYPIATQPPVWNNSLNLPSYTPGQFYEAQLPLSALTPASGKVINDIIPVALQSFLTVEPGNSGFKWLRGTIPTGLGSLSFTLRGVQSDSLTADKQFTINPVVTAPPVWNGTFTPPGYTPGTLYDQNVPLSALTPANGKNITSIAGVNLPGYLSIRSQGNFYYLTGTIPAGSGNLSITLRGIQSDGQTANQTFTLASLTTQPPVWNNSLMPAGFTAGQAYEQALPLTALTPTSGQTITDITGASLPSFLSVQITSGVRYLRGTVPAGIPSVSFTLRGTQSDSLTADRTFTIYAVVANPPVWNNSWTPPSFTPGSNYFQNIPVSALTPASGKTIANIVAISLPSYLTLVIDPETPTHSANYYLQGIIPSGTTSVNFTLQGVQSDGLTADKVFAIAAVASAAAPVWNNTFSPLGFTPGAYYEQYLPLSALTPASGKTITNILPYGLPSYLNIRTDGNGLRYLNGTIPAGTTSTSFTLQGVQSDGLFANKTFTISALVTTPPAWNNSLVLPSYTIGQPYSQQLPFTALTPASGKAIADIIPAALQNFLTIQTGGSGYKVLSGTIPTGYNPLSFILRGVQSDGLTADKTFTIAAVSTTPPVWNSSFTPPNFTAGQSYFQNLPVSALTPASGKTITSIVAVSLPSYLTIQVQAVSGQPTYYYLTGTIPAGVAQVSFVLQGRQSDGLTADKTFTISAVQASVAPAWNGSLVPANYTPGAYYDQLLPFTALTPASGRTITDIQAVALPSYLTVQSSGGNKYLRGTIPAGSGNVIFTLKGVQSDGQTANYSFQISAIASPPPVWNGSWTPVGFTAGAYYDQNIPLSALTPASGKTIATIQAISIPNYLTIQSSGGALYLRGTIPTGTTSINFTLQGIQSDGQTANQPFLISAGSTPSAPPVWNGSLSFPAFTPGTYYEKMIPFSSLTPYTGRAITDIQAVSIPSFLSIQPGGSGYVFLRGTVPTSGGYTQVSIALRGVQSDSLSANNTFTIYAVAVANRPPRWDNPLTSPLVASYNTAFSFTWPATQASDPDGDAITWSLEYSSDGGSTYGALPSWASFNPATRTFTGTSATSGNAYFRRKVSDPGGLFAYNTFTLNTAAQPNPCNNYFKLSQSQFDALPTVVIHEYFNPNVSMGGGLSYTVRSYQSRSEAIANIGINGSYSNFDFIKCTTPSLNVGDTLYNDNRLEHILDNTNPFWPVEAGYWGFNVVAPQGGNNGSFVLIQTNLCGIIASRETITITAN